MILRILTVFIFFLVSPLHAEIQDSRMLQPSPLEKWFTLTTDHFDIHFTGDHQAYAQRLAEIAEIQHEKLAGRMKMNWTPKSRTQIVVNDSTDFSNGGTAVVPYNQFFVYMNEPTDGSLKDQVDFVEALFTHEYTHVLHGDQVAGLPAVIRSIFGKSPSQIIGVFSLPQSFAPLWVTEGIAVYNESMGGYGRSHSALYQALMREEVVRGTASFTDESYEGYSGSRWPFGQVYLYGAYFFEFLRDRYGEDVVYQYIRTYRNHLIPWRMSKRARQATGKNARQLWAEFQQYLADRFEKDISRIRARGITSGKIVYGEKWENRLLTPGPDGSIFFYHDDKKQMPRILQLLADGELRTIARIKDVTSIQWHPQRGLLIARPQVCGNTRLYSDLYLLDPDTGRQHRLTRCARIPVAAWGVDGKAIYGVQTSGARSRLVRVMPDGTLDTLAALDYGESIGRPDVCPDGSHLVAAVKRMGRGWNLELFDLDSRTWSQLTQDNDIESFPEFSADGRRIYFVSDHGGQIELRRLTRATGMVETLSNSLGYVLQGTVDEQGRIWIAEYTGQGEIIRKLAADQPVARPYPATDVTAGFIRTVPAEKTFNPARHDHIRPYRAWQTLRPHGWEPVMGLESKSWHMGIHIEGQDILGFHQWSLSPIYYHFENADHFGGTASYTYNDRISVFMSSTLDVSYTEKDLGRPDFHEFQDNAQLLVHQPINRFEWATDIFAGMAWEKNRRIMFEDKSETTDEDLVTGIGLSFNNFNTFQHAITADTGLAFDLVYETFNLFSERSDHEGSALVFQSRGNLRFGKNQTLVVTFDCGLGENGGRDFSLGGSTESDETLGGITLLGRRKFALRGYSRNDSLYGRKFARGSLAWHFPIARLYNGFYIPPLGIGKIKGNLFTEAGDAWDNEADRKIYQSVGAELGMEFLIGYDTLRLPVTFGFAHGLDSDQGENVVYVRMGMAF